MQIEIKKLEEKTVVFKEEKHFKLLVNGKEIWVSKWFKEGEFGTDGDTEIFKGEELLTEEEIDEVTDYIYGELE